MDLMHPDNPKRVLRACQGQPVDLFFDDSKAEEAKAICRGCLVQRDCLDYSLEHELLYGIYGGLNRKQRVKELRFRVSNLHRKA